MLVVAPISLPASTMPRRKNADLLSLEPRVDIMKNSRAKRLKASAAQSATTATATATAIALTASRVPITLRPRCLNGEVLRPTTESDFEDSDYKSGQTDSESSSDDSSSTSSLMEDIATSAGNEESDTETKKEAKKRMVPDNIITPWPELKSYLEATPCSKCLGKRTSNEDDTSTIIEEDKACLWRPTLCAKEYAWGAMTDVVITCTNCRHERVICPAVQRKTTADATPKTRKDTPYNEHEYAKFSRYPINSLCIVLCQHLGCGTDGLDIIFAHLGLAPARGGYWKWRTLQDVVGVAEHSVYEEVVAENTTATIQYYEVRAKQQYTEWLNVEQAADRAPTQATRVAKMQDLLHFNNGRIGIEVGMDGAWQRRAIGFGKMNSMSGMNFCVDLNTKKILNLVVYSKQCTYCDR